MSPSGFDLTPFSSASERLTTLQHWGVLRLEAYLNEEAVSALLEEQPLLDRSRLAFPSGENRFPKSEAVFRQEWMKELADDYLVRPHSFNEQIELIRTSAGQTHADLTLHFGVRRKLRFLLYLTDAQAINGCFHCEPGSHLQTRALQGEARRQGKTPTLAHCRQLAEQHHHKVIPIEGKKGTLLVFDTDLFHKAGRVEAGERIILRSQCVLPTPLSWRHSLEKWKGVAYSTFIQRPLDRLHLGKRTNAE